MPVAVSQQESFCFREAGFFMCHDINNKRLVQSKVELMWKDLKSEGLILQAQIICYIIYYSTKMWNILSVVMLGPPW